jgi:hypothetical protein
MLPRSFVINSALTTTITVALADVCPSLNNCRDLLNGGGITTQWAVKIVGPSFDIYFYNEFSGLWLGSTTLRAEFKCIFIG